MRYCSGSPGSVTIECAGAAPGEPVSIKVADDGIGIAPELRAQVFEPFFTTRSRGTGLGLYIARELCEANGATLELIESGSGAQFRISRRSI